MGGDRRTCQPVRAVIPEGETRQGFVSERRPFPDRVCVAEHSAFGAGASLSRLGVAGGCIAEVGAQRALPSRGLRSEPRLTGAAGGGGRCWSACGAGAAQASRVPQAACPACPGAPSRFPWHEARELTRASGRRAPSLSWRSRDRSGRSGTRETRSHPPLWCSSPRSEFLSCALFLVSGKLNVSRTAGLLATNSLGLCSAGNAQF